MASSGSVVTNTLKNSNYYVNWQIKSQSVSGNYTDINWQAGINANQNYWYTNAMKINSIVINGTTVLSGGTYSNVIGGSHQLASGTTRIYHNSDGTKSFSISISGWLYDYGNCSGSGSWDLTTIPRASSISSISGNTVGSNVTVNISRKSDSFTHKVYFTNFAGGESLVGSSVGTSCTFVPSINDCSQIPNAVSGTASVRVDTYSGSTLVGSATKTFTLNVPSSVVPSISSIVLSEANEAVSSLGVFVQNKSSLNVQVNATGIYGSSIKNYKVEGIENNTYNSSNFTSSVLTIVGTRTITATVTDSRGRTATATTTYTCIAYSTPTISSIGVLRCNADGTTNENGSYVKYTFIATVSPIEDRNGCYYQLAYKASGTSQYTYITLAQNIYSLNDENVLINDVTFNEDLSYDFEFIIKDHFNTVVTRKVLGTAFVLMNFNASGKGMAFGKVSEKPNAIEYGIDVFDKYGEEIFSPLLGGVGGQCAWVEGDWNTACETRSGFYMGQNMENSPTNYEWFYVIHLCHNENWIKQIAFSFYGSGMWVREKNNGNWNAWRTIE